MFVCANLIKLNRFKASAIKQCDFVWLCNDLNSSVSLLWKCFIPQRFPQFVFLTQARFLDKKDRYYILFLYKLAMFKYNYQKIVYRVSHLKIFIFVIEI